MKKILSIVIALALCLTAFAALADTIKLGGLAPMTGSYAEYGKGFEIGWNMALEDIGAEGVNGHTFEIEVKDSQGDAVVSSTLATDYAEDDEIYAILGDFTSGACKADAEIVDRYGITLLSPTASAPDYAGMSPYCFSIMGRQDGEAPFLAKYVLKKYLGVTKVAVVRVDSDWGQACFDNFKIQADIEGLEVTEEKYSASENDFSSIITKVKAANPEVLVVMDQGEPVAKIFNAADAAGWDIKHVALGPGTSEQVVGMLTNPDNIIVTSPFFFDPNDEALTAWKTRFVERAGFEPTVHPACAYDTMMLIKTAVEKIGDGKVTREAIKDALTGMEMTGVTGRIKFGPEGDITRDYMICGTEHGKWVVLKGFDFVNE